MVLRVVSVVVTSLVRVIVVTNVVTKVVVTVDTTSVTNVEVSVVVVIVDVIKEIVLGFTRKPAIIPSMSAPAMASKSTSTTPQQVQVSRTSQSPFDTSP